MLFLNTLHKVNENDKKLNYNIYYKGFEPKNNLYKIGGISRIIMKKEIL
jgi:hypothetical protein